MTTTVAWPANKRCAVVVSVLFDDGMDAIARGPDLARRPKSFSVWQYGANRGVETLLRCFDDAGIDASWFVPAAVAGNHPRMIRDVAAAGHAIESRGWAFETYADLDPAGSRDLLTRAREALEEISGKPATGFRLPIGNWPASFDALLKQTGHTWSASLNGDDVPYLHPSGLVEIPVHVELEDRPYFQFNFTPPFPKGQSRIASYDAVLGNWIAEFDAYRRFGLCFVLQLRPEITGTPGRISLVRALLDHIRSFDDVWITTGSELAAWHGGHNGQSTDPHHPINIFAAYRQEQHHDEG